MNRHKRSFSPKCLSAAREKRKKWTKSQNQNTGQPGKTVAGRGINSKENTLVLSGCYASFAASRKRRNSKSKRKTTIFLGVNRFRAETSGQLKSTLAGGLLAFWHLPLYLLTAALSRSITVVRKRRKPGNDVCKLFFGCFFVVSFKSFFQFFKLV